MQYRYTGSQQARLLRLKYVTVGERVQLSVWKKCVNTMELINLLVGIVPQTREESQVIEIETILGYGLGNTCIKSSSVPQSHTLQF